MKYPFQRTSNAESFGLLSSTNNNAISWTTQERMQIDCNTPYTKTEGCLPWYQCRRPVVYAYFMSQWNARVIWLFPWSVVEIYWNLFSTDNENAWRPKMASYFTRWVTYSPALGKHSAPLPIFPWNMFILTDSGNIYVLESISSWI